MEQKEKLAKEKQELEASAGIKGKAFGRGKGKKGKQVEPPKKTVTYPSSFKYKEPRMSEVSGHPAKIVDTNARIAEEQANVMGNIHFCTVVRYKGQQQDLQAPDTILRRTLIAFSQENVKGMIVGDVWKAAAATLSAIDEDHSAKGRANYKALFLDTPNHSFATAVKGNPQLGSLVIKYAQDTLKGMSATEAQKGLDALATLLNDLKKVEQQGEDGTPESAGEVTGFAWQNTKVKDAIVKGSVELGSPLATGKEKVRQTIASGLLLRLKEIWAFLEQEDASIEMIDSAETLGTGAFKALDVKDLHQMSLPIRYRVWIQLAVPRQMPVPGYL
jgi:hypothetical protein